MRPSWSPGQGTPSSTTPGPTATTPPRPPMPTTGSSNGSAGTCRVPPVSDGAVLGLVAVTLAVLLVALFRPVAALDAAELTLRRLVAGMWSARRTVPAATELAATVERDAARGRAELDRLQSLKR